MSTVIYTLEDFDGVVRYVGCTKNEFSRWNAHRNANSKVGAWIRKEHRKKRPVRMVVQERFEGKGAFEVERDYVQGFRRLVGDKLFNSKLVGESKRNASCSIELTKKKCIHCSNRVAKNHRGLCTIHLRYFRQAKKLQGNKAKQDAWEKDMVDAGMILPTRRASIPNPFLSPVARRGLVG